ncbi:MAG: cysteine--tRNA ligase [Promethearchaeota archaeon]
MTPREYRRKNKSQKRNTKLSSKTLQIYNSITKQKEVFTSIEPGIVRMYSCGLTVNNLMHIGHARCYIFWDVIERFLSYIGYQVKHVSNVTDISIDDRLIKRIKETGESFQQLIIRHTRDYFADRRRLGIADPLTYSLATQHIHEMIEFVQRLIDSGHAYVAEDGVYFRISTFPEYGKLAGISHEALREGAGGRIDKDEYDKESVGDFVLWKTAKPGEPYWFSPWGKGRPGWHIECSAMAMKYLGETLDISGGGEDNIFPHHENTIAQSEAATGRTFVKFWVHVRHLSLNGEKMSKSTGNFITARDAVERYGPAAVRLFLLSAHYRKPIDFNEADLIRTQKKLDRIQQVIAHLDAIRREEAKSIAENSSLKEKLSTVESQFLAVMNNDFNTSLALSKLFAFIKEVQTHLEPTPKIGKQQATQILTFLQQVGTILFGDLYEQEVAKQVDLKTAKMIELLLKERERLRQNREFERADTIRTALQKLGINIEDSTKETLWW